LLKGERKEIERYSSSRCSGVRQHFLCFDRKTTPLAQEAAGFLHDSTIGYRDICGYRCGTGYPFLRFDDESGCQGKLLNIPLVVMDSALLIESAGQRDPARMRVLDFIGQARNLESAVPILWHNTSCTREAPAWLGELFEEILSYSTGQDGWVTNSARVYEWWHQRRNSVIRIVDSDSQAKTITIENGPVDASMGIDIFVPATAKSTLGELKSTGTQTYRSGLINFGMCGGGTIRRIYF